MLSLNGINLIVDNPERELEQFIYSYIPPEHYCPWLTAKWPGFGLSSITFPIGTRKEPRFRLNKFYWPTGASRWAYGFFLCASSHVEQIISAAYSTGGTYNKLPFLLGGPTTQADGLTEYGETLSTDLYVLPPFPLSGIRALANNDSLYLLTLVDQRYFWWNQNVGNMVVTPTTTWSNLYNMVASQLGILTQFGFDTIDPAYLQPSTMFNLPYEPAPLIFDAIADNLNQRLVFGFDGSVYGSNSQTAITDMEADMAANPQRLIIAGGNTFNSPL